MISHPPMTREQKIKFYAKRIYYRLTVAGFIVFIIHLIGCGGGETLVKQKDDADAQQKVGANDDGEKEKMGVMEELRDTRRKIVNIRKHTKDALNKLSMRGQVDFEVQRQYETVIAAYLACVKAADRPPKDWTELRRYGQTTGKDLHPLKAAERRGLEIFWEAPIDRASAVGHGLNVLIAYERSAQITEGWVIFADGNVAKIGPEQLNELMDPGPDEE